MTKGIKRSKMQIPSVKNENGEWAKSNKEKANLFAEHLFKTFQPLPRLTNKECISQIKKKDSRQIKTVTLKELTNEINNNLSTKKAPVYDLITGINTQRTP